MKVKLLRLQESWNWQASSLTLKSVIDTILIQEFSRMVYTHPERLQKKWKYFVPTSCIAFIQEPVGQSYVTINQIIWNDIIVWSNESIIANRTQMTLPYDIILETDQLAYLPIESDPFSHRFYVLPLKEIPASTLPSVLTNEGILMKLPCKTSASVSCAACTIKNIYACDKIRKFSSVLLNTSLCNI